MELKLLILLNLFIYSVIVSQSFMYMIALKNVQESMDAPSYIQLRKLLDRNFLKKFKPVVYSALFLSLVLAVVSVFQTSVLLRVGSILAFIGLIADTILILKGDMPINRIINTWSAEQYPADWKNYRSRWLFWFGYRQLANIGGFVCLLTAAVFT